MFDGQSLNLSPYQGTPGWMRTYPVQLLALLGADAYGSVVAIPGTTYAQRDPTVVSRVDEKFPNSSDNVVLDCSGTSDLFTLTAAQLFAASSAYAYARQTKGAKVVALTVTGTHLHSPAQDAQRLAYNDLLRASTVHDAIADVAAIPELTDINDTTYFFDQTHVTEAGAALMAQAAYDALVGVTG